MNTEPKSVLSIKENDITFSHPMHVYHQEILDIVKNHYPDGFDQNMVAIGLPPKKEMGEIAIGVFGLSKTFGIKPLDVFAKIQSAINACSWVASSAIIGPYLNIKLSENACIHLLQEQISYFQMRNLIREVFNGGNYKEFMNFVPSNSEKTVIVDYFSANIGKPLHIGHMCSPNIGQVILNCATFLGWNTVGDNHLGDWGGLFGKLIVGFERYGDRKLLEENAVEHLFSLYVKVTAEAENDDSIEEAARHAFKLLSESDPKMMVLWGEFTSKTVHVANEVISLIDVYPDVAVGESYYEGLPLPKIGNHPELTWNMKEVVQELIELGIATKNEDGSVGVIFPEETKIPSCMLAKKDGTHGYLASDLACVKYRLTNGWNPDYIYYCTDVRQELHFRQVFAITKKWLEIGGWGKEVKKIPEFIHVKNGYIRLKEGAMSSRKGNIVRLEDLLDEAFIRTQKILEEKNSILSESDTRAIAVGAVKYSYLMQDRERDIIFDWDKALNFEGHSGPYIQYSYVRAKNILDKAKQELQYTPSFEMLQKIPQENSLLSEYDRELLQTLLRMKEVIELTLKQAKPHHLANYSYELATNFSSFYVHTPKLLEEKNQTLLQIRLALVMLTWQTLGHVFALLAIRMPSKM